MAELTLSTDGVDLPVTLSVLAFMPQDPTVLLERERFARATHTPHGPGEINIEWSDNQATIMTSGPGSEWLAESAPALLGLCDDPNGFRPEEPTIQRVWAAHPGLRVPRTNTVWHDLLWWVVQQRVTRNEAARTWRALVLEYGSARPSGLLAPPAPNTIARLHPDQLRRTGLDQRRSQTLIRCAVRARSLERLIDEPAPKGPEKLRSIPGVGPWTASCLSATTWGYPDTVIVGDAGIPSLVASMLNRRESADDDHLVEMLQPYQPHRYRIIQLAFAHSRRGPASGEQPA